MTQDTRSLNADLANLPLLKRRQILKEKVKLDHPGYEDYELLIEPSRLCAGVRSRVEVLVKVNCDISRGNGRPFHYPLLLFQKHKLSRLKVENSVAKGELRLPCYPTLPLEVYYKRLK